MKLKVQQKLGLAAFKEIETQIKGDGLFAVPRSLVKEMTPGVHYPRFGNKIERAFNLGKKVEVLFKEDPANSDISDKPTKFEKVHNVYYLVVG